MSKWEFVTCGYGHKLKCPNCKKPTKFGYDLGVTGLAVWPCKNCGDGIVETQLKCEVCKIE